MTVLVLKKNRMEKKRTGLYLDKELFEQIQALADDTGISFNEAAVQMLEYAADAFAPELRGGVK